MTNVFRQENSEDLLLIFLLDRFPKTPTPLLHRPSKKEANNAMHTQSNTNTTSYLYDSVLSPFYDRLAASLWPDWVHPNVITLLGAASCVAANVALNVDNYKAACLYWTLYHMCDNMDGKHARRTHQTSSIGGFLDHVVDGTTGAWVGYRVVAEIVFGTTAQKQLLFYVGRHGFCCTWLSPHIVRKMVVQHQKKQQVGLVLGTKWCSVDEGFLAVSALLLYRGWIDVTRDEPMVWYRYAPHLAAGLSAVAGLVYVAASAIRYSQVSSPWFWSFAAFWMVGFGLHDAPNVWWLLWAPLMMISTWHSEPLSTVSKTE